MVHTSELWFIDRSLSIKSTKKTARKPAFAAFDRGKEVEKFRLRMFWVILVALGWVWFPFSSTLTALSCHAIRRDCVRNGEFNTRDNKEREVDKLCNIYPKRAWNYPHFPFTICSVIQSPKISAVLLLLLQIWFESQNRFGRYRSFRFTLKIYRLLWPGGDSSARARLSAKRTNNGYFALEAVCFPFLSTAWCHRCRTRSWWCIGGVVSNRKFVVKVFFLLLQPTQHE